MDCFAVRFGRLVRRRRGIEQMSQMDLAERAFGNRKRHSRICEIENARYGRPQQRTIDALVTALAIPQDEIDACYADLNDAPRREINSASLKRLVIETDETARDHETEYMEALDRALSGKPVDIRAITGIFNLVKDFAHLDDVVGGAAIYTEIQYNLERLQPLLKQSLDGSARQTDLHLAMAHMTRLAGWAAQDAGHSVTSLVPQTSPNKRIGSDSAWCKINISSFTNSKVLGMPMFRNR